MEIKDETYEEIIDTLAETLDVLECNCGEKCLGNCTRASVERTLNNVGFRHVAIVKKFESGEPVYEVAWDSLTLGASDLEGAVTMAKAIEHLVDCKILTFWSVSYD
jgi:hypothetical protein